MCVCMCACVPQAWKMGQGIDEDGSCIAVRESRVGMPMDVQAGWHDSTAHVQGFSCLKREADDCDVIR